VAACGSGLLPLLIAQSNRHNTTWITKAPLNDRLGQILPQFFLGPGSHAYAALMWVAFVLGVAGLVLLAKRASITERNLALGVAGSQSALCARDDRGLGGSDTVLTRNLLGLWLPVAIVLACGLGAPGAGRLGIAIAAVIWRSVSRRPSASRPTPRCSAPTGPRWCARWGRGRRPVSHGTQPGCWCSSATCGSSR